MTFMPFEETTLVGGRLTIKSYSYPPEPVHVDRGTSTSFDLGPTARSDDGGSNPANNYVEVYRLDGEMPGGYVLMNQLPVYVTFEVTEFVAEQQLLDVHAFGDSPMEAVLLLRERLIEHYERLEELGDRLSPQLKSQRRLMRELFVRRDA